MILASTRATAAWSAAITTSVIAVFSATDSLAIEDFVASPDNPVLSVGPPGAWDGGAAFLPEVITRDGLYYLFYTGQEIPFATPGGIGFATSTDGANWTKADCNPVLAADGSGFDALGVAEPVVILDGDEWIMYYNGLTAFNPSGGSVGRATASDPCGPWTRTETPILSPGAPGDWDADFVTPSSVIPTDDGFVMYYSGSSNFFSADLETGRATSVDGIVWAKYDDPATTEPPFAESDPVLRAGPAGAWDETAAWLADVGRTADGWELYYAGRGEGGTSVGYATSSDGISWVKSETNPIFTPLDDPAAPGTLLQSPSFVDTDTQRLLYYDYGIGVEDSIGYAVASLFAPLGGTVVGINARFAACVNATDPQSVVTPLPGLALVESWDCEALGLTATTGDTVRLIVSGTGFTASFAGRVDALEGGTVLCRNLKQGVDVTAPVANAGGWSCTVAGLPVARGDRVQAIVTGTAQ
jgi:hypothetical protein